jgi:hypothetical protein
MKKMKAKQKEGKGKGEEISQNLVPDSLSSQKRACRTTRLIKKFKQQPSLIIADLVGVLIW